ncbi:MAG: tetratricopeptide repeat protein, partial [Cellvibrionaceae bacterium]
AQNLGVKLSVVMKILVTLMVVFLASCKSSDLLMLGIPENTIRYKVYKEFEPINGLVESGQFEKALNILSSIEEIEPLTAAERFSIQEYYGYTYYEKGDVDLSIRHYSMALTEVNVTDESKIKVHRILAEIFFSIKKYDSSIDTIRLLEKKVADIPNDMVYLKAKAHFQDVDCESTIQALSIVSSKDTGKSFITTNEFNYMYEQCSRAKI